MIKTDSRESMTDQQRWVMDNLLGETVTSTQYEVANLPAYGIRGSRSYQPYIIATNQLGMKIHELFLGSSISRLSTAKGISQPF